MKKHFHKFYSLFHFYLILFILYLFPFLLFSPTFNFIHLIFSSHSSSLIKRPRLCKSNHITIVNSTSNDVIFLFASRLNSGLELTLKSLKSTMCKAKIIIFTNKHFKINNKFKKVCNNMDILIEFCNEYDGTDGIPHMLRFKCEYEWLKHNQNNTDRVLHTDAFDIFFQKDPFDPEIIHHDDISFVVEPHFIHSCGWNLKWFQECYGEEVYNNYSSNFIVCSGTIAGNSNQYFKLLELMLAQKEWKSCYGESKDQPILNYLIWSGKVDEKEVKYHFSGCDGGFATLKWCLINSEIKFNEYGQVILPSNNVPAYLHQYDRIPELSKYLYNACGIS